MKHIGEDTHLSTLESIGVVCAFVFAVLSLLVAFTWSMSKA